MQRIIFEPTYRCNLKCKMCVPFPDGKYKDKEMSIENIKTIFDSNFLLSQNCLVELSGGEPFLHRDIVDIITVLLNLGYKVGITTNGWFTEKVEQIIKINQNKLNQLYISISIDGLESEHDEIRGVHGSFIRAIETIKILKENNVGVHINSVLVDDNLDKVDKIKKYFSAYNANVTFLPLAMFNDDKFPYTKEQSYNILPLMNNAINQKYVASRGKTLIKNCSAGETGCFIGADGTVFTCLPTFRKINNSDEFIMGNLADYDYNFKRLYDSESAKIARNNVKKCIGCAKNCEVSREFSYNNMNLSITKSEASLYKKIISNKINFKTNNKWEAMIQGFHQKEPESIWTSKEAKIILKLSDKLFKKNALNLTLFNGNNNINDNNRLKVKIYLDNTLSDIIEFNHVGQIINKQIELKALNIFNKILEVTIQSDKTFVPGSGDDRELGICVTDLEIK